jgi:hypothetical protein
MKGIPMNTNVDYHKEYRFWNLDLFIPMELAAATAFSFYMAGITMTLSEKMWVGPTLPVLAPLLLRCLFWHNWNNTILRTGKFLPELKYWDFGKLMCLYFGLSCGSSIILIVALMM